MAKSSSPRPSSPRSLARAAAALGGTAVAPVAAAYVSPLLTKLVMGAEVSLFILVLLSAMYGSEAVSERAFRLLRLLFNRPEPPKSGESPTD